jgi:hypothetical protein
MSARDLKRIEVLTEALFGPTLTSTSSEKHIRCVVPPRTALPDNAGWFRFPRHHLAVYFREWRTYYCKSRSFKAGQVLNFPDKARLLPPRVPDSEFDDDIDSWVVCRQAEVCNMNRLYTETHALVPADKNVLAKVYLGGKVDVAGRNHRRSLC